MFRDAAYLGISSVNGFWHLTPKEINNVIIAHSAQYERLSLLAWEIGQYVAVGVNNPKKYPKPPQATKPPAPHKRKEVRKAEPVIKAKLQAFADMHNAVIRSRVLDGNAGDP